MLTERFISKPKGPSVPSMYDVIISSYDKQDIGYYQKQIKLYDIEVMYKKCTRNYLSN